MMFLPFKANNFYPKHRRHNAGITRLTRFHPTRACLPRVKGVCSGDARVPFVYTAPRVAKRTSRIKLFKHFQATGRGSRHNKRNVSRARSQLLAVTEIDPQGSTVIVIL